MKCQNYLLFTCMILTCCTSLINASPFAYIASPSSILVVDVATNMVVNTIPVPGAHCLYSLALTPDNRYVYVTDSSATQVFGIDLITNTVSTVDTSGVDSNFPLYIAITSDGSAAYVTFDSEAHLAKISIPSNTVTPYTLQAPDDYAYVLAIAPNDQTIYLSGDDETPAFQVSTFSIITQEQSAIDGVGNSGYIPGLAITSDSDTLYACSYGTPGGIVPITNLLSIPTVQPTITINSLYALALSPDNKTGYAITETAPGILSTVDLSAASITANATIGDYPQFVALTGDGNYAYVTNGTTSVYVVNTKTNAVSSFELDPIGNGIAIGTTPPPSNVVGTYICNVFLDKTESILHITWSASPSSAVTSYNIYNGTTLVASVSSTGPLCYNALLVNCTSGSNFSVTAVSSGGESVPVSVSIQS